MNDKLIEQADLVRKFLEVVSDEIINVVRAAKKDGWYLNTGLFFLLQRDYKPGEDINHVLENSILSDWDVQWERLFSELPHRKNILDEGKKCFEMGMYYSAIQIFYSQADGIFHERFNIDLYKKSGTIASNRFAGQLRKKVEFMDSNHCVSQLKNGEFLDSLVEQYLRELVDLNSASIVESTTNIEDEENLPIPSRHGVLHGVHTKYGSKRNALKVFTFLVSIFDALDSKSILSQQV
jgi:hypothetical protein